MLNKRNKPLFVKLDPLNQHGADIVNKHGNIFKIREVTLGNKEFRINPAFRVESLKEPEYMPLIGYLSFWFWLELPKDNNFEFHFVKE